MPSMEIWMLESLKTLYMNEIKTPRDKKILWEFIFRSRQMNKKNILYIGIELDNESHKILKRATGKRNGWKQYCRTMILIYNTKRLPEIPLSSSEESWVESNLGKEITIIGYAIGESDKSRALRVMVEAPCKTKFKHITLETNQEIGGKPADSNKITSWKLICPIILTGRVSTWYM